MKLAISPIGANKKFLTGNAQTFTYTPCSARDHNAYLLLVLTPGDYIVVDEVALTATVLAIDTAESAFVWFHSMLLHNWDADRACARSISLPQRILMPSNRPGARLRQWLLPPNSGIADNSDAVQIVTTISNTLLMTDVIPRYHGLWPHWSQHLWHLYHCSAGTEWSSVDTATPLAS
ncbi:MAG: hypothetical protein R3E31_25745 [Chloroflexota bacterium]